VKAAAAQLAENLAASDLDAIARIAQLRAALEEIRDLDADVDYLSFVHLAERIAIKALATDPYAAMPPELVEALRAYEKSMFSGDVRTLLKPTKKRKVKKKP
jgi:hypothetical protein